MKFIQIITFVFLLFSLVGCISLSVTEKKSVKPYLYAPVKVSDNFIWGINGHPVTALDYTDGDLNQEFELLNEHQFEMYRIDIRTDSSGNVVWHPERFDELLSKSVDEVKILPIIIIDQFIKEYALTPDQAFALGKRQSQGFVRKYGNHFEYYELGNEQERKIIFPNVNGSSISNYDQRKFEIVSSYLRGMVEGIKLEDPSAKLLVSASWLHWGYFDLLESAGVHFDIISYHWYSNMGSMFNSKYENVNIINTLTKRYNKPIWITEINKKDGSIYDTEEEQAYWVDYFIDELDYQSNIKALFIYELYDEPNLKDQDWISEGEAYYGIVKWNSTPKQYNSISYKPVSDVLKFRIEEIKYGYVDFISSLLRHLEQEEKDAANEQSLLQVLQNLKSKEMMVDQLLKKADNLSLTLNLKTESEKSDQINTLYNFLLNRNPTPKEIKYWSKRIKRKNTNVVKTILLSQEYWENAVWSGYEKRTGYSRL